MYSFKHINHFYGNNTHNNVLEIFNMKFDIYLARFGILMTVIRQTSKLKFTAVLQKVILFYFYFI